MLETLAEARETLALQAETLAEAPKLGRLAALLSRRDRAISLVPFDPTIASFQPIPAQSGVAALTNKIK